MSRPFSSTSCVRTINVRARQSVLPPSLDDAEDVQRPLSPDVERRPRRPASSQRLAASLRRNAIKHILDYCIGIFDGVNAKPVLPRRRLDDAHLIASVDPQVPEPNKSIGNPNLRSPTDPG